MILYIIIRPKLHNILYPRTFKINMRYKYINQQDAQISVIKLYFPLDALHVSDYVSPSSGATFISCTSHLVYATTSGCCVVVATQQSDISENPKCVVQLIKVAPDDGLTYSETCRASNEKIKFNHRNLCNLLVDIHIGR